jgi:predicted metal-dependent enzyme (double-stranded beta helix superfamily)
MTQFAVPTLEPVQIEASTAAGTDTELRNDSLPSVIEPRPSTQLPAGRYLNSKALAAVARQLAGQVDSWRPLLHVDPDRRWYTRLATGDGWEAWLLTWLPGQGTDLHDHGGSSGAFTVLSGELQELTPAGTASEPARLSSRVLRAGQVRAFGPRYIHQVVGVGDTAAASLHVYGPALTVMNRYELDADLGPVIAVTERAGQDW